LQEQNAPTANTHNASKATTFSLTRAPEDLSRYRKLARLMRCVANADLTLDNIVLFWNVESIGNAQMRLPNDGTYEFSFLERREVMTAMVRRVQGIKNELGIRCGHDYTGLV
jgi:hypothetical protein